jgi:hypothetical protein
MMVAFPPSTMMIPLCSFLNTVHASIATVVPRPSQQTPEYDSDIWHPIKFMNPPARQAQALSSHFENFEFLATTEDPLP